MSRRILSAEINHETNTFSILPTTLESYKARRYYFGEEIARAMKGTRTEMGAHIDAAKKYGWRLVQPISAQATPGGKSTPAAWAELKGCVMSACAQGPFDGVILALHGAMVTEDQDDAEGDLLKSLRDVLGPKVPVAVTLDLHGNVTDTMAQGADIILAYRTYPHIDQYEVAAEAADLLQQTMEGKIRPRVSVFRRPVIDGCDYGRTQGGPMSRLLARAAQVRENDSGVLAVALCAGFPWADIPDTGPSVTITTDGDHPGIEAVAAPFLEDIWNTRNEKTVLEIGVEEAMDIAKAVPAGDGAGPLVLADFSDNPGSGGYGDGIGLLRAMIKADFANAAFACVADAEAARKCADAGIGASLTLALGAKVDPATYGPSLKVQGCVENITDGTLTCRGPMNAGVRFSLGPTAVMRIGGLRVIIATHNFQVYDLQFFKSQGIDPRACDVLAVKSWHHFRAAFEPISRKVFLVDSGCLVSMDLKRFPYQKIRRPIWPLDPKIFNMQS